MSAISLAEMRQQLALWLAANKAVATGQSYSIGDRSLTRANAKEIRDQIDYWSNKINRSECGGSGGPRVVRVIPRDL